MYGQHAYCPPIWMTSGRSPETPDYLPNTYLAAHADWNSATANLHQPASIYYDVCKGWQGSNSSKPLTVKRVTQPRQEDRMRIITKRWPFEIDPRALSAAVITLMLLLR